MLRSIQIIYFFGQTLFMHALDFWKAVTMDQSHFLDRLIDLLTAHDIAYCVIGGQAVNAYAEQWSASISIWSSRLHISTGPWRC